MSTPEKYVPTTARLCELWSDRTFANFPEKYEYEIGFYRWLAEHDARVRSSAIEEAALWIEDTQINGAYPDFENEYTMAEGFRDAKGIR